MLGQARLARAATVLAFVAPLVCLLLTDYLPTNDGPQNAYAAFARSHVGEAPFSAHFHATYPLTAFGWGALFAGLERLVGWRAGYAGGIVLAVAVWQLGALAILRALPRARWPLSFAIAAGALQWALYMGFFNWVLGVGLGLWAIGVGLRDDGVSLAPAKHWLVLALLLVAASASHAFGAQVAGATLMLHVLLGPRSTRFARLLRLAAVGLPSLVVTVLVSFAIDDAQQSAAIAGQHAYHPPLLERLRGLAWFYTPGAPYRWLAPLGLAALGYGVALRAWWRQRTLAPGDRAILLAGALFLTLALVLPRHGVVWQNLSPRFVPLALLFGALLVPMEALSSRLQRGIGVVLVASWLFSTGWAAAYHLRVRAASERWLAGLGVGDGGHGTFLPIVMDASMVPDVPRADLEMPFLRPHINLGVVYAMDRFAASPTPFSAFPAIHVVQSSDAEFPRAPSPHYFQDVFDRVTDPAEREAEAVRLASYAAGFDEALVIGPEDVIATFVQRGFRPVARGERLLLARFEGCPTRVIVDGVRPRGAMTVVVGWDPAYRSVEEVTVPTPDAWPYEAPLRFGSCGAHWLTVATAGLRCRDAGPDGALHIVAGAPLRCELTGP